jgi:hypothetical protein
MSRGTDLLALVARRWYFYVIALVVAGVVVLMSNTSPRVYTAQAQVSFEPPLSAAQSEEWVDYTETMIHFSKIIDMTYAAGDPSIDLSAPRATLFGNGVREGKSIELFTSGNQWVRRLDRPVIVVNINSTDMSRALADLESTSRQIAAMSDRIQADIGVPARQRITAEWDKEEFSVSSFGRTRQGILKGSVIMVAATLVFATLGAALAERWSSRKRDASRSSDYRILLGSPDVTGMSSVERP